MTLTISPSTPSAPFDALAPLRLPPDLRLTPEQFEQVCAENREAVLELAADGRVMRMPPVGGETSLRNAALTFQLAQFVRHSGGWVAFASCTGFRLPDGSVLSPDASLVRRERWQALTAEERRGFAPLCPELVVELVSCSDAPGGDGLRSASALRRKMASYQANGSRLGWLLLPEERAVEIWLAAEAGATSDPRRIEQPEVVDGGPEFPGLRLELEEIWSA